jgi:predicted GNAT family N-acyltransferase
MTTTSEIEVRPVEGKSDWEAARDVRIAVFVREQDVRLEGEFDEFDETSRHFVCLVDGEVVGTARWRALHDAGLPVAKLERFAVLRSARGLGCGHGLVEATLQDARQAGFTRFLLHAQAHLQDFYGAHGFRPEGPIFLEEHLKHVRMTLTDE